MCATWVPGKPEIFDLQEFGFVERFTIHFRAEGLKRTIHAALLFGVHCFCAFAGLLKHDKIAEGDP